MLYYITELSKYIISLIMILYCVECVLHFFLKNRKRTYGIYVRQGIYLFFLQFFSYLTLCLRTGKFDYLFFYAFLQIVIFSTVILYHIIYPKVDRCLLNNMVFLLSICFIILTRLDFEKAKKQFFIVILSIIISMFIPYIIRRLPFLQYGKWIYALIGFIPLMSVLILGQVTHGSKISFSLGGITLQPSEFVKLIFIFCIAAFLWESASLKNVIISGIIAAVHILILTASKDLGSALIFFVGYLFILFVASRNYLYLLLGTGAGSLAAVAAYHMFSHVQVRVQAFLDPFRVIDKQGYQISQSLFAIGCGSWFGTGLNKGIPSDIPYVESDFIFSAISEEMGVIVSIGVLLVCISCFLIMMDTAVKTKKRFYRLVSCGLGVIYIFQVFLTVGGGIKFIPLTGVTLPLVSYGGSSIMTSLILFAIIQGIILINKEDDAVKKEVQNGGFDEDEEEYEDEDEEY